MLSYLIYPVTIVVAWLLAYYGLYVLAWPLQSVFIPIAIAFGLCAILERLLPYRPKWNQAQGDIATDLIYIGINTLLREALVLWLKFVVLMLALELGQKSLSLTLWPNTWSPLLQAALAIVVLDFFEYWFHRASHRFPLLWRFHAVHHSPGRLYFLNAARFHAVEWAILVAIEVIVLSLLGADAKVIALAMVFIQIHGLFQHSNIRLQFGPLNYLLSGPELHRWHHSKLIEESDRNFGNNVIVWDLLFGTWFLPRDRQVGVLGLINPDYPQGFLAQASTGFRANRDKPADYKGREAEYEELIAQQNQHELVELAN